MDTITFGAFPRSGNYYFQHLVQTLFDSTECWWLSHRISDWDRKPNKVTVVRDPLKSVASWISTTKDARDNRADKVLEWYIAYHNQIVLMGQDIVVLPFDFLVSKPSESFTFLAKKYGLIVKSNFDKELLFLNDWQDKKKWDFEKIVGEISQSSLYNEAKTIFCTLIKQGVDNHLSV